MPLYLTIRNGVTNVFKQRDLLGEELEFDIWCKRNQYNTKQHVSEGEAFDTFKEEVYEICIDKLRRKDQYSHFSNVLDRFRKWRRGDFLDVDRAKEYPIEQVYAQSGHKPSLKRNVRCLFHEDQGPSMRLYQKGPQGSFYCFGCNKSGDTITLLQQITGMNFKDAVKFLT